MRIIFHTIDLYFGEEDTVGRDNLNRGLDIFDRVKAAQDPTYVVR